MNEQITLEAGLGRYQMNVSILKKGYVQESYRIKQLSKSPLAKKAMSDITSVDIATYRDARLGQTNPRTGKLISGATVRLELALLSNLFDIGRIEWGACDSNPVSKVRKPKPAPGRDRTVSPREERKILRYCNEHPTRDLYCIVVLALETAMRQSELLRLEWEHINLRSGIAHLPETKNGNKRDVPLSVRARMVLQQAGVKAHGRVFSYTANGLKSAWRKMTLRLAIEDLHFHDLRHTATTKLFELDRLDLMEIAAITGHKSLAMLKRYTHLKAARLVKKLEGSGNRGRQAVMSHLLPYPAVIEMLTGKFCVRLLDFEDLMALGETEDIALQRAQDALLRHLVTAMRDRLPVPKPHQYLHRLDESQVFMLDPLPPPSIGS